MAPRTDPSKKSPSPWIKPTIAKAIKYKFGPSLGPISMYWVKSNTELLTMSNYILMNWLTKPITAVIGFIFPCRMNSDGSNCRYSLLFSSIKHTALIMKTYVTDVNTVIKQVLVVLQSKL
jgi:hypothetical protein